MSQLSATNVIVHATNVHTLRIVSATNVIVHATNVIVATFLNMILASGGGFSRSCPQCPENTLKLLVCFTNITTNNKREILNCG